MEDRSLQPPLIVAAYARYLSDQDSATFIRDVARHYTCPTLERLAQMSDRSGRRAAVLALGFMGDYNSNAVVGRALTDRDRGVRTIAENAIQDLWVRVGSREQRLTLRCVIRLNQTKRYDDAIQMATELIHESPWIAEAWRQRGAAHYNLAQYEAAIRNCHQALEINPYHFAAATGIGQSYLFQDNPVAALDSFRRALRLNPGLEDVRAQVIKLQRSIRDESDAE
ncbi:tetratricopeptide repeat protein [Botrimarina mediterranea]|uniref:tetratricopeptide repeat protein n=1 Tax=Botrimarina mediterranea TaxID=2528022 RepID=UPI0018D2AE9C|nr:tetratricopeptide repeat protein [Botrimarina mediterranea]